MEENEQSRFADLGQRLRKMHTLDRIAIIVAVIVVVIVAILLTQHIVKSREIAGINGPAQIEEGRDGDIADPPHEGKCIE